MKVKKNNLSILLFILLLISCDFNTVYHTYNHIPLTGWNKNDTLYYNVTPITYSETLQTSIEIRNNSHYPYSNLYLFVHYNLPDTSLFFTDTIECILADEQGKWKGEGLGTLYQSSVLWKDFHVKDSNMNYQIKITHGMTDSVVKGIVDVGIHMKKQIGNKTF